VKTSDRVAPPTPFSPDADLVPALRRELDGVRNRLLFAQEVFEANERLRELVENLERRNCTLERELTEAWKVGREGQRSGFLETGTERVSDPLGER
jgi:hypothetical protein